MGSYLDFKNFGEASQFDGSGGKAQENFPLARQSSIYNLTFDELQTTFSGFGKDFGSMNMDELLKNIWTAEETQAPAGALATGNGLGNVPSGGLQKQGSLTLPRTLSQKTVDEVWKDLFKEAVTAEAGNCNNGGSFSQQRQQTLEEMTLEEFLSKAGVVKEEAQATGSMNNGDVYGQFSQQKSNNFGLATGFPQQGQNVQHPVNRLAENHGSQPNPHIDRASNMGGTRPAKQQARTQVHHQRSLYPKQANVPLPTPMHLVNSHQMVSPGLNGRTAGTPDISFNDNLQDQVGGLTSGRAGVFGLSAVPVNHIVGPAAKQMHLNIIPKGDVDTSSLSPSPCSYGASVRGRKRNSTMEKVVERRHKRMIKNRESAARSRARKQAYTLELEEEVAKLKELNEELQKKQAVIIEMENNQILEKMKQQRGGKRICLRRTLTGPW